jgi:putative transposase
VIRRQAYRFRLRPTDAQAALLRQYMGCARLVWNAMLFENDFRYVVGDPVPLNRAAFSQRLNTLKERLPFLRDAPSQPLQQTLNDLAKAYAAAFDPKLAAKLPVFKKKGRAHGIRFPQGFEIAGNRVVLPKLGDVLFRQSKRTRKRDHAGKKIKGDVKNVTVRSEGGKWFVSFQVERDGVTPNVPEPVQHPKPESAVALDLGIKRWIALSDGTFIDGPNPFERFKRVLAKLQRQLAKKVKFSKNWQKIKRKIGKLHTRIANIRKDATHKASAAICKNHAIVVMEDLVVANMVRSAAGTIDEPGVNVAAKSALNRRIQDQNWGTLRQQNAYKSVWNGGLLRLVPPQYTSQDCNACGHRAEENRPTQALFLCVKCGHTDNADTNAAKNILQRAG